RVGEGEGVAGREDVLDAGRDQLAVHAELRALARRDVHVAGATPNHLLQQGAQVEGIRVRGFVHCAAVSLITSSSVVMPRETLASPSIRSVSIPSFSACS